MWFKVIFVAKRDYTHNWNSNLRWQHIRPEGKSCPAHVGLMRRIIMSIRVCDKDKGCMLRKTNVCSLRLRYLLFLKTLLDFNFFFDRGPFYLRWFCAFQAYLANHFSFAVRLGVMMVSRGFDYPMSGLLQICWEGLQYMILLLGKLLLKTAKTRNKVVISIHLRCTKENY